jgi:hypothetical protein
MKKSEAAIEAEITRRVDERIRERNQNLQKQDSYRFYLRAFAVGVTRSTPDALPPHEHQLKAVSFGAMDAEAFLKDPAAAYTDRDPSFADSAAPVSLPVDIATLWKRVQG